MAVASEEFKGSYSDQMSVTMGDSSPAKSGKVAAQEIIITNNGTQPGLYRLTEENEGGWDTAFTTNVIEVAPGETVSVPLFVKVPTLRPKTNEVKVTVTSEVSGKSASATATVKPDVTPNGTGAHDTTRPGTGTVGTPVDITPAAPVDEAEPVVLWGRVLVLVFLVAPVFLFAPLPAASSEPEKEVPMV